MLQCSEAPVREAALGWLLDASASVRNSTASALEYSRGDQPFGNGWKRREVAVEFVADAAALRRGEEPIAIHSLA